MRLHPAVAALLLTTGIVLSFPALASAQTSEGGGSRVEPPADAGAGVPPVVNSPGINQVPTTNQSDVTGPNPLETFTNQSDVTGPEPLGSTTNNPGGEVNRAKLETSFAGSEVTAAISTLEEFNAVEFQAGLGLSLYGTSPSAGEISNDLSRICNETGERAAVIYAVPLEKQLQLLAILPNCASKQSLIPPSWLTAALDLPKLLFSQTPTVPAVPPQPIRKVVPEANRAELVSTLKNFRRRVSDPRERRNQNYLPTAQKLYQWLVQPLDSELKLNRIDTLVYSMGPELRSLPLAALNDGNQFLIEQYNVAQIPSFGMTDTRLSDIRKGKILAMGASQFTNLPALPSVPTELKSVINSPNLTGQGFVNQEFTLDRFTELNRNERYSIVHLATHGEFRPGNLNRSYIQFWDQRLSIPQLQALAKSIGWRDPKSVPVDLLVLSACKTALGDNTAELGFAGLALSTGIKSTMASLWNVSDLGTLTLMSEFYQSLGVGLGKAQSLRQAQLQLLQGKTKIANRQIVTSSGTLIPLPQELEQQTDLDLRHPYFWSAFTLFGNWH